MAKSVVVYLPDGFADWEGPFLLGELAEQKRFAHIVSESGGMVTSIGGMTVETSASITSVKPEDTEALVLIGSDTWVEAGKNQKVLAMAREFHQKGILVAGICAATVALARIGMLNEKKHTSNDLGVLKKLVPDYRGEKNYQDKSVVVDGNLITAPGIAPIDFTFEIMNYIGLYTPEKRKYWFNMFKNGIKPPASYWES